MADVLTYEELELITLTLTAEQNNELVEQALKQQRAKEREGGVDIRMWIIPTPPPADAP